MKQQCLIERDEMIDAVERVAGSEFSALAKEFVLKFLALTPEASSETITLACKEGGIVPHDDRAFGAVYMRLAESGLIERTGITRRMRGHGTMGASIWRRKVA